MKKKLDIQKLTKGLTLIGYCLVSTILSGCGDFLEVEPRDKVILEQFWNSKTDVDNTVAGCYDAMQSTAFLTRIAAWGEFRSENVKEGGNSEKDDLHMYKLIRENIDASNVYTNWASVYNVINRCNTVIHYAPEVSQKDPAYTESELKATIAEVSAIRDLCYFYLIRTFQNVPFTFEPYTDDNQTMDLPATGFYQVLDTLIADLEGKQNDAVRRYPTDGSNQYYQTGRITQDAIHAMLCEMYLWKQDYAKCIAYADKVIESKRMAAKESGGQLYSDMTKYFNSFPLIRDEDESDATVYGNAYNDIFGTGNSSESIFELTFMRNDNMPQNGFVDAYYGYDDGGWYNRVIPSDYVGYDEVNGVFKVFRNTQDSRSHESFNPYVQSATKTLIGKYVISNVRYDLVSGKPEANHNLLTKYAKNKCHANWIFYRLTDVMLMKAEALVESSAGDNTPEIKEAFTLANTVNKRSIMKDLGTMNEKDTLLATAYTTKAQIQQLVRDERHRELLFEGKHWFDLVRYSLRSGNTEYLRSRIANKGLESSVGSRFSRLEGMFWPYNLDELKVNKNLQQNPAFGSGENSSYEN